MTLNEILDQGAAVGHVNRQSQSNVTNLIVWTNQIINDISTRYSWPWLHTRTALTTVADTVGSTTVTVACTLANATVTGTGTSFASTDVNRFIQFDSSKDWYKITAVASATSATIEPAYALATESGMDFTIRTLYYDLPSDCAKVFDIRQARSPQKLTYVDTKFFDLLRADQTATGIPRTYYMFYYSNPQSVTGQQWAVSFDPIPSEAMLMEVRYHKRPRALSVGTDIPEIPVAYHGVIVDGLVYKAMLYTNNPATGGMKQEYEKGIERMRKDMPQTTDDFHVIQPIDEQSYGSAVVPFPSQYGWPYGA